jgi:hypothetical protein
MDSIHINPDHPLLREQVTRFLAREPQPSFPSGDRPTCSTDEGPA